MENVMQAMHAPDGLVERWIAEIRARAPKNSMLTTTLQTVPSKGPRGFLVSFRLRLAEESLASEARADTLDEAVSRAGRGLCEHLPSPMAAEVLAREGLFSHAS